MTKYHVTIYHDRYPFECTVEASGWAVAAARGTRLWANRFKRSRTESLKITIIKGIKL